MGNEKQKEEVKKKLKKLANHDRASIDGRNKKKKQMLE